MADVPLTLACGPYAHTRALGRGAARVAGVDLHHVVLPGEEVFWRMLRHEEFDASELSLSSYCRLRSQGDDRFAAIPVFPSRLFRHGAIYVADGTSLASPAELRGRRVGVPEYELTAAVWVRGLLQDEYGLAPSEIAWRTGGVSHPGREGRLRAHPPGVDIRPLPPGEPLEAHLLRGEIDALVDARAPRAFVERRGIRRLLPASGALERDYFRRSGVFPVMHTIVLRSAVVARHPWLPVHLLQAFEAARDAWVAEQRNANASVTGLPWIVSLVEQAADALGPSLWPYGLDANRPTIETFLRHASDQGLLAGPLRPEDLFVPSTLQRPRT